MVTQVHGTWAKAERVPGLAALNTGNDATIADVSCASAGNCSTGGGYDRSGHFHPFVVSQVNGTWAKAETVHGPAALNTGRYVQISGVSCASAGDCSAGGTYADKSGHQQGFVVSQVHGTWAKAEQVPGLAALNTGGYAQINSVSCASAGHCSAGGYYADSSGHDQAFVVSQS